MNIAELVKNSREAAYLRRREAYEKKIISICYYYVNQAEKAASAAVASARLKSESAREVRALLEQDYIQSTRASRGLDIACLYAPRIND